MDILRTASNRTFNCVSFAELQSQSTLYIRVSGASIAQVSQVFANPDETKQLWYNSTYYSGYTKLTAIIPEGRNTRVCLRKE